MRAGRRTVGLPSQRMPGLNSAGGLTGVRLGPSRRWAWLLLIPLLAGIAALVIAGTQAGPAGAKAAPLAAYVLAGPRSPACVRIVVIRDQSGSMTAFQAARDDAMRQLVSWSASTHTLRATDSLAIVDFAGDGKVALSTTPIRSVGPIPGDAATNPDGSDLNAAIEAVATLPTSTCRTSLIVLSDALVTGLDSTARAALTSSGVTNVALILPGHLSVPDLWKHDFPYADVFVSSGSDPDLTARSVAQAVAHSVGQRMEKR